MFKKFGKWVADHWDTLANIAWYVWTAGGGVVTAWTAAVGGIFAKYAPFSWVAAGLVGAFIAAAIAALIGWLHARINEARLYQMAAATSPKGFNRLEQQFTRQTILVNDLIHPLGEPVTGKTFIDCEFYGPGILGISEAIMDGFSGGNVEMATVKEGEQRPQIPNKAMLMHCHFVRCKFYNIVVMMTDQSLADLERLTGSTLRRL